MSGCRYIITRKQTDDNLYLICQRTVIPENSIGEPDAYDYVSSWQKQITAEQAARLMGETNLKKLNIGYAEYRIDFHKNEHTIRYGDLKAPDNCLFAFSGRERYAVVCYGDGRYSLSCERQTLPLSAKDFSFVWESYWEQYISREKAVYLLDVQDSDIFKMRNGIEHVVVTGEYDLISLGLLPDMGQNEVCYSYLIIKREDGSFYLACDSIKNKARTALWRKDIDLQIASRLLKPMGVDTGKMPWGVEFSLDFAKVRTMPGDLDEPVSPPRKIEDV